MTSASSNYFTLPTAWPADVANSPAVIPYQHLAAALSALADGTSAGLPIVLAAAHIKVLSMLTEDCVFRTDVRSAPDNEVHVLSLAWDAASTWRDLVDLVWLGWRAARVGPPGEDVSNRALFTTGQETSGRYGLCACVRDEALVLHAAIDDDSLVRLVSMYRCVLEAMADNPDGDARAARLPSDERHAVLSKWAAGPSTSRTTDTVVDLFQAQATRTPSAIAVRAAGTSMTYRELDERSNQIARHLLGLGVRPEIPVGVCLRRGPDLLPALFGVWKSGAGYLPLDPGLPAQRLRRMVSAARCELVVTAAEHLPALGDGRFVLLDEERATIAAQPRTHLDVLAGPKHLAYVIYTSGSTGDPKGVLVQHDGLANYLLWTVDEYAACGTGGSAVFTSLGFDLGVPSLYAPVLTGQAVDLLPDPVDTPDLGALLAAGAPYSFLKMTPGHLNLLSSDLSPTQAHDLAGLVVAAGDAFPVELARRWSALAGPAGTAVATEYGPTEITVGNSGQPATDLDSDGLVPLGAPIPNTTMYVLTERLEPVPIGVPGEVYVGGAGVARGYLGDPALTAERFLPDPYGSPGARLYRTGDRARWRSSGSLEFLGREDHQLKIRGYRVEPGEIQETLRRHPDVGEALVVVCEQPSRQPCLAAFVIPAAGRVVDASRLRADLATDLPEHMVPAEIVAVGEIPLTTNGKADTHALRSLL